MNKVEFKLFTEKLIESNRESGLVENITDFIGFESDEAIALIIASVYQGGSYDDLDDDEKKNMLSDYIAFAKKLVAKECKPMIIPNARRFL